jgi:hypothetical protein
MKSEDVPATETLPFRMGPALPALGIASLLAAGTSAYGAIVYSGVLNSELTSGANDFNLNADSYNDISLEVYSAEGGYLDFRPISFYGSSGLLAGSAMAKLSGGATIGSGAVTWGGNNASALVFSTYSATNWAAESAVGTFDGYVGFKFRPNSVSPFNYAWLQLSVTATGLGNPPSFTLVDWAYENSGAAIQAGNTGAIPEPSAVALVMGAASLLAVRRRRRQTA